MKKALIYLFFIVLLGDTYAISTQNQPLRMIFKPLLMTILAGWYWLSVKKPNFWFVSALFFSFCGDVLLLFEDYFIFGLASFLMTHIFYILIISQIIERKSILQFAKWIIPFLVYFSGILYLISNKLNDLLIPVLAYGSVISIFGMTSLVNYLQNKSKDNLWLFFGAILFIISDSLIAINQFYFPNIAFEILIIILYAISQYIICRVIINKQLSVIN